MLLLHSLLMNYPTVQTFIQSKSTSQHAEDMLKTCYWSCILQSSKFFGVSLSFFRHSVGHVPLQWWCCYTLQGN